ncbi:MAG: 3-dehydroquinate synthase, partial [Bacteroidetes bacterium]|nr:3-dehydroquinate synthase [Bacteroidota bacterium]
MLSIGKQSLKDLNAFLNKNHFTKIGIIVDENSKKFCLPIIQSKIPKHYLITIPSGEHHKNLTTCETIWQQLTDLHFDKRSLIINLGGGVIGDMGGFCAATFKRGIAFIQVPTTLLAQVDASIGGKVGVDFQNYKNHIGLFKDPEAVFIYPGFLKTLDKKETLSGFAEIIKHCLIADRQKWNEISQKDLKDQDWENLIAHSIDVKLSIIKNDPEEKGLRKVLNFGHTIGHALETFYLNDNVPNAPSVRNVQ